jgi:hypothetical protein
MPFNMVATTACSKRRQNQTDPTFLVSITENMNVFFCYIHYRRVSMRRHKAQECNGTRIFTETVGDGPEYKSEFKVRGTLFSLYIFKNRKWVKVGEYCDACGFHFNEELLRKVFGDTEQSGKTVIEIEGKQVIQVYSHEFPRRFNVSFRTQTKPPEESRAIVPCGPSQKLT